MHTSRNIAGATAVLTALVLTLHNPADAQRRGGDRGDGGRRGGGEMRRGGGSGSGNLRGADLARARTGGQSALNRMTRSGGRSNVISSGYRNSPGIARSSRGYSGSSNGHISYASSRNRDRDRGRDRDRDYRRRDWDRRDWSRHHDRYDRRRYRSYDRGWDNDNYYFSVSLGGGFPSYSSYYSSPYYSAPYYGYGYTSPYAYYGYPYSPYSGYNYYTGYSSYYGTGGYYW